MFKNNVFTEITTKIKHPSKVTKIILRSNFRKLF